MTLRQRLDEMPLLRSLSEAIGLGSVYESRTGPGHPRAAWIVTGTDRCAELAHLLAGTVRGRKAPEFELWASVIDTMASSRHGARAIALAADNELKSLRQYQRPRGRLWKPPIPRVMAFDIVEALKAFARQHDGALDALTYMRIRREHHPEWPARNTVARHFGGWRAALEAAGFGERAAASAERFANRSRTTHDAQRERQRRRVLEVVQRCAADVGRTPRAMEFFRWRLANEPDTPTQATVYKLFPGGWPVVLEALAQLEHELDVDAVADDRAA